MVSDRIAGKAISFHLALGPVVRLFTWEMYATVRSRVSWDMVQPLCEFIYGSCVMMYTDFGFWISFGEVAGCDTCTC